jgi:hypothetical protein
MEASKPDKQRLCDCTEETPEDGEERSNEAADLPTGKMCARAEQVGAKREARQRRIRGQGAK